jgi:integrase/recombinase XerD
VNGAYPMTSAERARCLEVVSEARTRALVAVMGWTGCRISEALALRWSDIRYAAPQGPSGRRLGSHLRFRRATVKGGPSGRSEGRWVPLSPTPRMYLEQLRVEAPLIHLGDSPVFRGQVAGSAWSRSAASRALAEVFSLAECCECSSHSFRGLFVSELSSRGVPLATIRELVGHRHLATTQRYLRGSSPDELESAVYLLEEAS